jgi:hypothetical protein
MGTCTNDCNMITVSLSEANAATGRRLTTPDTGYPHRMSVIIGSVHTHPASICARGMPSAVQPFHLRHAVVQRCCPPLHVPALAARPLLLRPVMKFQVLYPAVTQTSARKGPCDACPIQRSAAHGHQAQREIVAKPVYRGGRSMLCMTAAVRHAPAPVRLPLCAAQG